MHRFAHAAVRHRRPILVAFLLATLVIGSGVVLFDPGIEIETFEVDSPETDARHAVDAAFDVDERTFTLVAIRDDRGLTKAALADSLAFQRDVRNDERVAPTLVDRPKTVGLANAVVAVDDPILWVFDDPPGIEEEIAAFDALTEAEVASHLEDALRGVPFDPVDRADVAALAPHDLEPGDTDAEAHLVLVVHDADTPDEELLAAQHAVASIAESHFDGVVVFGEALAFESATVALGESFALLGPLMLLTVLTVLFLAYRDPLDVAIATVALGLLLLWVGGFAGWMGLSANQLLVAVPFLLVGLGIDYGLHLLMRVREERREHPVARAVALTIAGVGVAIALASVTTAIGFLTGMFSPVGVIRSFALVAAFGMLAACVVFGVFVPTMKLELERLRARRSRRGAPAPVSRYLPLGGIARWMGGPDRTRAVAVVVVALVLASGGFVALGDVDTTSDRADFLPGEPPTWMTLAPAPLQPSDHDMRERARFIDATFEDAAPRSVDILVTGEVTDPATIVAVHERGLWAEDWPVTVDRGVTTPLDTLDAIADDDPAFAAELAAADSTGDGLPDTDVASVFDAAFEADAAAASASIARGDDGAYEGLLIRVHVEDDAADADITFAMRAVAETIEAEAPVTAVATGGPILEHVGAGAVVRTAITTFALAVAAIGVVLAGAYRARGRSWSLGLVTLAPVVVAIGWLLGTLWVLELPYNAETAIITGIVIGIGVDYAVHVTERFVQARAAGDGVPGALSAAVGLTGATLVASAVTTVAGFGILALTLVPSLQRFGLITVIAIGYALVASAVVLPALLYLWDGALGPFE